jgi:hypothetical protein
MNSPQMRWSTSARDGAHLALVEREHAKALERLLPERVVVGEHVGEEHVGALAAELERDRDEVLGRVLHDEPAGGGLAGERHLGHAVRRCQRLAGVDAEAVHHVDHAGRQQVGDELHQQAHAQRGLLGGLEHDRVAGRERGRELPRGHEQREVPRDDLPHHPERLVQVVGHRVLVELGHGALLRADAGGEVTEVIDGERQVGRQALADRLAVVPRLGHGQPLERALHAIGDRVQEGRALGGRRLAPRVLGRVRRVEGELDVVAGGGRHLAERLTRHRRDVLEVLALDRLAPLAADEVLVAWREPHERAVGIGDLIHRHRTPTFRASPSPGPSRPPYHRSPAAGVEVGVEREVDAAARGRRCYAPAP